jgi:hypothetical protein
MRFLQERFDLKHRVFAFPHNDWNVSREFFAAVSGDGLVEATFGTSSPAKDCVRASFQRFSMEKTTMSARAILARQCLRKLKQRATGRSTIQRPTGEGPSRRTIDLNQARPPSST